MEELSVDVLIVGAGPAGLACLRELRSRGVRTAAFDPEPGGWPMRMDYFAHEVGGSAKDYVRGLLAREMDCAVRERIDLLQWGRNGWLAASVGHAVMARHVVIATGLQIRTAGLAPGDRLFVGPSRRLYDDTDVSGMKVAIIGGGDNALEYACMSADRGSAGVTVYHRTIRAIDTFVRRAKALPNVTLRRIDALPSILETPDAVWVDGKRYDLCVAMLGFDPVMPSIEAPAEAPKLAYIGDLETSRPPRLLRAIDSGQRYAEDLLLGLK